jgi:creatinine amidohydrolase
MPTAPRNFVLHEANYRQLLDLTPNVAVLPWGATEAHNYHLPHGTDIIEATTLAEAAVTQANAAGAKCIVLPTIPFGNDNAQLTQVATITMRSTTQHMVLRDVAESLVRQKIDRLVLLNFHGGNEFKPMIRDITLDLPIFILQVHAFQLADYSAHVHNRAGDHANEFETSLILHLAPELVQLEQAGDGAARPSELPALSSTPGVWAPRDWETLTRDTGTGDPRKATAEAGKKIFDLLVSRFVPVLTQLSAAKLGQFPFVLTYRPLT